MAVMNVVTPKAAAKHELLLNKLTPVYFERNGKTGLSIIYIGEGLARKRQ
jgi:hypothetical protein